MMQVKQVWVVAVLAGMIIVAGMFLLKRSVSFDAAAYQKSSSSVRLGDVKKLVLANGLTCLLLKTDVAPRVFMLMMYKVGSAMDGANEKGMAHAIEHMLFKGTDKLAESDILAVARKYGATFNAETSWDSTRYFFETMKNNWQPFIPIFSDMMQNARLDSQHLASEIKTILQELKLRRDNHHRAMLEKIYEISFPPHHPYHCKIGGYSDHVAKFTAAQLRKMYKQYYRPDNAVFFMMGDFDIDEATTLIKNNFASIKNKEKLKRDNGFFQVIPHQIGQVLRSEGNVAKKQVCYFWLIPGIKDKDEVIPSLLERLLAKGSSGRLYKLLVEERSLAYTVSAQASKQLDGGVFVIRVTPVEGKEKQCFQLVTQELKKIMRDGFEKQEIESMLKHKERIFYEKIFNFKSFVGNWAKSYLATENETAFFDRPNLYKQGVGKSVEKFMAIHLNPLLMGTLEIVPFSKRARRLSRKIKTKEDLSEKRLTKDLIRTSNLEKPRYVKTTPEPAFYDFTIPKPDRILTLRNGLKVFLCKHGASPLVSIHCRCIDHDYLKLSLDGVTADLMLQLIINSRDGDKQSLADYFDSCGVSLGCRGFGIQVSMLNRDCENIIKHLVHAMTESTFSSDIFQKLVQRKIHTIEAKKGKPMALARQIIKKNLYKQYPFGWSFDEAIELLKQVTIEDMVEIREQHINAGNIVVAIVGNFDLDPMQEVVERCFNGLHSSPRMVKKIEQSIALSGEDAEIPLSKNLVTQVLYAPSFVTMLDEDFLPVRLLSFVAFSRQGSRLFALREEYGLFYGGFGDLAEGAGRYSGFDYVGSDFSALKVHEAEVLLRDMIRTLSRQGITSDELNAARQLYTMSVVNKVSSNKKIAALFTYLDSLDVGFDYYDKQLRRVREVTLEEVNKIAAKCFNPDAMSRIRIGRIGDLLKKEKK